MPSTPNNCGAPSRTGSINKSLLTPCRRVGLSRIRKTPNSLIKINLPETSTPPHANIENGLLFNSTETNETPIPHTFENSSEVSPRRENEIQNEKNHIVVNEKRTKKRLKPGRKSLFKDQEENIEGSTKSAESEIVSSLVPSGEFPNLIGENCEMKQVNNENSKSSKSQKSDIKNVVDQEPSIGPQEKIDGHSICTRKSNDSNAETSEMLTKNIEDPYENIKCVIRNSRKRNIFDKLCPDDDSDDLGSKKDVRAKRGKKDSKTQNKTPKTIRNTKSDYPIDYTTEKKTESPDSEEDFIPNGKKAKLLKTKSLPEKSSVIHISYSPSTKSRNKRSKKISRILSTKKTSNDTIETDDEFESAPTFAPIVKSVKVKLQNLSELEIDELSNIVKDDKQQLKHYKHDSDDELTCSPTVINSLVQKIESLETTIKQKRKKLEDLKQASVYKNMHNVEELAKLTEIWKNGCRSALSDLLKQLQMHNPIDMRTLVKNLKIPSDIIAKLKVFDSDSQDSV